MAYDRIAMADPWGGCECGLVHPRGCRAHAPDRDEHGVPLRDAEGERILHPCGASALDGMNVCWVHGGANTNTQLKARERLLALVDPALAAVARVLTDEDTSDSDAIRAAALILDRASETAKVSRQEISGPDGKPVEIEDHRGRDLAELIANDPRAARRLDRTARDLKVVKGEPAEDAG